MQIKINGPEVTFAYATAAEVRELFLGSNAVSQYYSSKKRSSELQDMQELLRETKGVGNFSVVCHLEGPQRNREKYLLKRGYEISMSSYGAQHNHLRIIPVRIDGRDNEFFYSPRNKEGNIVDFLHGGSLTKTRI